jgi:hypothetical protein
MSKPTVFLCDDFGQIPLPLSRVTKQMAAKARATTRRKWGKRARKIRIHGYQPLPLVLVRGTPQERRDYVADQYEALARLANKPTPIRDGLKRVKTELYWVFVRMRNRWSSWRRKNNA